MHRQNTQQGRGNYNFIALCALIVLSVPWLMNTFPQSLTIIDRGFRYVGNSLASVLLHDIVTVEELHTKYAQAEKTEEKIRILIVPGHEPDFGGTEYRDLKERDLVVQLAQNLANFLSRDSHYEVIVTRDTNAWTQTFESFFKNSQQDILNFYKDHKTEMVRLVNTGKVTKVSGVQHNSAPQDVALRLYGINKWVNDNDIDMAIHIHFNDYPRRVTATPGEYSGISIYVPERQYANSTTTRVIADSVFKRLSKYNAVSNLPKENVGIVEEQELIAIGSHNSLGAPSMLIEYGYIYEPQYTDQSVRDLTLQDLAFQTYLGIQDFFGSTDGKAVAYDSLMLPHSWKSKISKESINRSDVFALQTALTLEGQYPPRNKTKNDCPRSGRFGPCTIEALTAFQKKYGIEGEKEVVGEKTKQILNQKYSR